MAHTIHGQTENNTSFHINCCWGGHGSITRANNEDHGPGPLACTAKVSLGSRVLAAQVQFFYTAAALLCHSHPNRLD